MRIIERYIGKQVLTFVVIVTLLVICIEMIFSFLHETGDIGKHNYTLWNAAYFVVLTLPRRIYEYFPITALIGALIALGKLALHNELVVVRTVGYSIGQVILAVLKVAVLLMIFVTVLGEWVAPISERSAILLKNETRDAQTTLNTDKGTWIRHKDEFIYIQSVLSPERLSGITRLVASNGAEQGIEKIEYAAQATFADGQWLLTDLTGSDVSFSNVSSYEQPEKTLRDWINPKILALFVVQSETMSSSELWQYIQYLKQNQLESGLYELAFWEKVVQPFATAVMLFLAIPMVFGSTRAVSIGLRILAGAAVGFGFFMFNSMLGSASVIYDFHPLIAAASPTLLFTLLGIILLRLIR